MFVDLQKLETSIKKVLIPLNILVAACCKLFSCRLPHPDHVLFSIYVDADVKKKYDKNAE